MPSFINQYTLEAVDYGTQMKFINSVGEISPTSAAGIERESLVVSVETNFSVTVGTVDKNGVDIGPRKRPH